MAFFACLFVFPSSKLWGSNEGNVKIIWKARRFRHKTGGGSILFNRAIRTLTPPRLPAREWIYCSGQQVCVHIVFTPTFTHTGTWFQRPQSCHYTRGSVSFSNINCYFQAVFKLSSKNSFLCETRYNTRSQQESMSQSFFKEKKKEGLWAGHSSHSKGPVAGLEFGIVEVVCSAKIVTQLQSRSWFLQLWSKLPIIAFPGDRILGWVDAGTHKVRAPHIALTSGLGVGG